LTEGGVDIDIDIDIDIVNVRRQDGSAGGWHPCWASRRFGLWWTDYRHSLSRRIEAMEGASSMSGDEMVQIVDDAADSILVQGLADWLSFIEIQGEVIAAAREHAVQLWFSSGAVAMEHLRSDEHVDEWFEERVRVTMAVLRFMFDQQLIRPGGIMNGFEVWAGTPDEWLARIESEWRRFGSALSISDVCWLELTDEGMRRALELEEANGRDADC